MTADELKEKFPNASPQFIALNSDPTPNGKDNAHRPTSAPVVERRPRARPLAAGKTQGKDSGRFLVRVTSHRLRLLDEDNLCEKFVVDCCRYAGLIPTDSPDKAKIEVGQVKVGIKAAEKTVIEIIPIP